jgi:hypothetical protein
LISRNGRQRKICMLRDSGCLQSLVTAETCTPNEYIDTGETRLIQGIVGCPIEISLVEVEIDSDRLQGKFLCGLVEKLPTGVDVLWGNDIEGLASVAVITRAQAAKVNNEDATDEVCTQLDEPSAVDCDDLDLEGIGDLFVQPTEISSQIGSIVSRLDLINLQRTDSSLVDLMQLANVAPDKSDRSFYAIQNDVLVRHWRDRFRPEGMEVTQVVVPVQLRQRLLKVAHDIPSSGHLGTQKTIDRLLRHFWWPRIFGEVKAYCRSCVVCQKLGKGAVKVRAPLINLPVINKPFSRLSVDIVGPLQKCELTGNRFLLTVMDMATHFPMAFPLQSHTARDVANVLINVFTTFGFPDELLSDCGTEFV